MSIARPARTAKRDTAKRDTAARGTAKRLLALFLIGCSGDWATATLAAGATPSCDSGCLAGIADTYWAALLAHDTTRMKLASKVKSSENNVPLPLGRGLWATISGGGQHYLVFTDPEQGQVALTGSVEEGSHQDLLFTRLRVAGGKITEIESVVGRRETTTWLEPGGWLQMSSILTAELEAPHGSPRAALIKIADAYFDRIADPSQPTPPLGAACNRIENGLRTTNNPDPFPGRESPPLNAAATRMSCAEQFAARKLGFVTRVRDRRYTVVDSAKGIVVAFAIFDHDGDVSGPADGGAPRAARLSSPQPSPSSIVVAETFKIDSGQINLIQALLTIVPYGMTSAW